MNALAAASLVLLALGFHAMQQGAAIKDSKAAVAALPQGPANSKREQYQGPELDDVIQAAMQRQRIVDQVGYPSSATGSYGSEALHRNSLAEADNRERLNEAVLAQIQAQRPGRSAISQSLASTAPAEPYQYANPDPSAFAARSATDAYRSSYSQLPQLPANRMAIEGAAILNQAGPNQYSGSNGDTYTQAGPHGVVNNRTGTFSATN